MTSSLEDILVSLKDHFPLLRDDVLLKSTAADIDLLISDLHRLITAVKIRRNTLAPIQRIPDGVMSHILRYYCFGSTTRYTRDDFYANEEIIYTLRWVRAMLVCRRWYNLVLHDKHLWTFVATDRLRTYNHIPAQLKRSGECLLSLRHRETDDTKAYDGDILPVERIAHRVRRLELSNIATGTVLKILDKFELHDLPNLESLSVLTKNKEGQVYPALPNSFLLLPKLARVRLSVYDLRRASSRGGENAPPWEQKSIWTFYFELVTGVASFLF